jgi:hypothetical protein
VQYREAEGYMCAIKNAAAKTGNDKQFDLNRAHPNLACSPLILQN